MDNVEVRALLVVPKPLDWSAIGKVKRRGNRFLDAFRTALKLIVTAVMKSVFVVSVCAFHLAHAPVSNVGKKLEKS